MTFPGPGAVIYRNDAGEPLGWDYPDQGPPDVDDWYERAQYEYFRCDICGCVDDESDAFAWPGEDGFDPITAMERTGRNDRDYEWCHVSRNGDHHWSKGGC